MTCFLHAWELLNSSKTCSILLSLRCFPSPKLTQQLVHFHQFFLVFSITAHWSSAPSYHFLTYVSTIPLFGTVMIFNFQHSPTVPTSSCFVLLVSPTVISKPADILTQRTTWAKEFLLNHPTSAENAKHCLCDEIPPVWFQQKQGR